MADRTRQDMTTGEAEAWRQGLRDALFLAADEIATREDGGWAGNVMCSVLKRLAEGDRMPVEGAEGDWPMLRALFADLDALAPAADAQPKEAPHD